MVSGFSEARIDSISGSRDVIDLSETEVLSISRRSAASLVAHRI